MDLSIPPQVQGVLEVYEGLARIADEGTRRRIGTMLRHIAPPVLPPGPQMAALRALMDQRGIRPITDRRMLEDAERRDAAL